MINNIGMSLGYKVGASIGALLSGDLLGLVIAHSIPGRRRYSCKMLKNLDPESCAAIEQAVNSVDLITSCKVNPITGSLIVTYTMDERSANIFFEQLSHSLTGTHAQHEKTVMPASMISVSNLLNDEARAAKEKLKDFLNKSSPLVMSRLIGLSFVGYGVYRMIYRGDRPSAIQVFFWGLGLLLRPSHKGHQYPPPKGEGLPLLMY